jgi:ribosomal protein S18 acetylase RimI-like enzyme
MPSFQIRKANEADAVAVARLFIQTRTECLPYLNWTYDEPFMISLFAGRIDDAEPFLVAEEAGEIIGFIRFTAEEVDDLYVLPKHHGKGVGKALLTVAKREAGPVLRLWVFQANSQARAFYEAQGFAMEFETEGVENMEKCPDARYVWRKQPSD